MKFIFEPRLLKSAALGAALIVTASLTMPAQNAHAEQIPEAVRAEFIAKKAEQRARKARRKANRLKTEDAKQRAEQLAKSAARARQRADRLREESQFLPRKDGGQQANHRQKRRKAEEAGRSTIVIKRR